MGLLDVGKVAPHQDALLRDVVARYKNLRSVRLRLNNDLVQRLSRDVLHDGAKRIGMLRGGTLVFGHEDETSVLMDYCIYDVCRNGRNAIEQYICDCPTDPDSDEGACLRAMQSATYALLAVVGVEPGVGCHVRNLFTEEARFLVDIGFAKTAQPGAIIATRLLDFGSFVATGGAALPVGILDEGELEEWQQKVLAGADDAGFDPAALIRACLQGGASSAIRHEETDTRGRPDIGNLTQKRTPSQRKKARAKLAARKSVTNMRCTCGSGKMFKNCCGKC